MKSIRVMLSLVVMLSVAGAVAGTAGEDLRDRGKLGIRVYAFTPLQSWSRLASRGITPGSGNEWLRFGALKDFMDGSFMFEPWGTRPDFSGAWAYRFPGEDTMARNILDVWNSDARAMGRQARAHALNFSWDRSMEMLFGSLYPQAFAGRGERVRPATIQARAPLVRA